MNLSESKDLHENLFLVWTQPGLVILVDLYVVVSCDTLAYLDMRLTIELRTYFGEIFQFELSSFVIRSNEPKAVLFRLVEALIT